MFQSPIEASGLTSCDFEDKSIPFAGVGLLVGFVAGLIVGVFVGIVFWAVVSGF